MWEVSRGLMLASTGSPGYGHLLAESLRAEFPAGTCRRTSATGWGGARCANYNSKKACGFWHVRPRLVMGVLPRTQVSRRKARTRVHAVNDEDEIISVQELADGSIVFAFGAPTQEEVPISVSTLETPSPIQASSSYSHVPRRLPSSFHRKSPISTLAVRRDSLVSERTSMTQASSVDVVDDIATTSGTSSHVPSRWPSSFIKKSPMKGLVKRGLRIAVVPQETDAPIQFKVQNVVHTSVVDDHGGENMAFQSPGNSSITKPAQEPVPSRHHDRSYSPGAAGAGKSDERESVGNYGSSGGESSSKVSSVQPQRKEQSSGRMELQENFPQRDAKPMGVSNATSTEESSSKALSAPRQRRERSPGRMDLQENFARRDANPMEVSNGAPSAEFSSATRVQPQMSKGKSGSPRTHHKISSRGKSQPQEDSVDNVSASPEVKPSRPLSVFVKRTPISLSVRERKAPPTTQSGQDEEDTSNSTSFQGKVKEKGLPVRVKSRFVKQSPVPAQRAIPVVTEVPEEEAIGVDGGISGADGVEDSGKAEQEVLKVEDISSVRPSSQESLVKDGSFPVETVSKDLTENVEAGTKQSPPSLSVEALTTGDLATPVIRVPTENLIEGAGTVAETGVEVSIERSQMDDLITGDETGVEAIQKALQNSEESNSPSQAEILSDDMKDFPEDDLETLKLPELKEIAKSHGLKGFSKFRKKELINLIRSRNQTEG